MKNLSLFNKVIYVFTLLAALAILLAYLSEYISPLSFVDLAFLGFAYPVILIFNILFLLHWLVRRKIHTIIPLIAILIGWWFPGKFLQFGGTNSPEQGNQAIKLLSYNVRLFDLYNWTENKKTRNKILTYIKEEAPDILCLQEFFYNPKREYFDTLDTLLEMQGANNYHAEYTTILKKHGHHFGIATFSKYPIIKQGKVELSSSGDNICIYTDVIIEADTIRVYNMHLASIKLAEGDYEFIDEINDRENEERIKGIVQIMGRMRTAYTKRAKQADAISAHIQQSPYPVIVCGDFNDTPVSYAYRTISSGLKDAFMEQGSGLGNTYNGNPPFFRIDYVFHHDSIHCTSFETPSIDLSDHFPLVTHLTVP